MSISDSPSGTNRAARLVDSIPFTAVVIATIVVNAVALGLQTYDGLQERWGGALDAVNAACVAVFIVELGVRIRRTGRDLWRSSATAGTSRRMRTSPSGS